MADCRTTNKPFPGADAHPDKRGGELCVEGTNVRVAGLLEDLVKFNLEAYARGLGMDPSTIRACVNGLANWLGTQNWTKPVVPGAGHVVGENCPQCGSVNYGPDGAAMADACWDCGYVKPEKFDAWTSIPVEKTHQLFIEEAQRMREDLETAARATEVGKRYSAMSSEEFAALRKEADARKLSPPNTVVDSIWASKLSRALDVIERVTDERDRCTKARLAQIGVMPPGEEFAEKRKAAQAECEKQRAAQAGGGFRCPECETVFLDTGFPQLPGERGDGGPSGWRVTCPECKHEWNCLNHLTSVADRLADLEKDVRQLFDLLFNLQEGQEIDEKWAVEKRCGMCAGRAACPWQVVTFDGPPWDNCWFWKPKEKQP